MLTFDKGITTVVGPNGSGKSNISDAIRWVLGEQSVKTLRCSKMEDVIFNGTTERKAKGFASVTLTIMNSDRRLAVDDDEIAITRRFYRSGESEYLINKDEVRLKDIHELLMDTGLGRDGYSMISQGKIDSIVASKSEDRREIFEEAAGISRYRYRKLEAQKKLEQTEENLIRLHDIFRELEERIGPLREQSQKAKEYLELANQKKSLEIGTWLFTLSKSGEILRDFDDKISISQAQHEELESSLEAFAVQLEEISKNILSHTASIDELRREIAASDESSIKKSGEISVLQNDILHNNENVQRLTQEISEIEKSFPQLDATLEEKHAKVESLRELFEQKNAELQEQQRQLEALSEKISTSASRSTQLSERLAELNKAAAEAKVRALTAESSLEGFARREAELDQNIATYQQKIDVVQGKISADEANLSLLRERAEALAIKLASAQGEVQSYEEKCRQLRQNVDKLGLDAQAQERKVRLLEELERNLDGFAHSVKFIMKEVGKKTLSGVHGPVSRLIKVPSEYAVAVETALGAAMQNLVVDNEETAKKAILLLKKNNVGRATFLPVSTIKGSELQERNLDAEPGVIGLASKVCTCDEAYAGILRSLLGKIVIVDTIDNAVALAKRFSHRFRIVTLDGQVLNAGGSLTGGALSKNAGLLNRAGQVSTLKKEAQALKDEANRAEAAYEKAQEDLAGARKTLDAVKAECEQVKLEYNDAKLVSQQNALELNSLKSVREGFGKEKFDLAQKVQALTLSAEATKGELEKLQGETQAVEEALREAGDDKNEIAEQREVLNGKIHELHLEVFSTNKDIEALEAEVKSLLEGKNSREAKRQNLIADVDAFKAKNVNIEQQISDKNSEIAALKGRSKELEEQISALSAEKISLEKNITDLRNSERSKLNDKEKIALELARLEDKKAGVQKEYDVIIAKLWDEYELTRREALAAFEVVESTPQVVRQLSELRLKLKALGVVNVAAIEEYQQVSERYEFMSTQINDVETSKRELYRLINDLTAQMKTLFIERFQQINENFNAVFKELFGGGKAEVALTDPSDVLNSGINIFVQPPGKIVSHLELLSGGEKALVAIALYFAIMKVSPAPFCVLDEIEAALDEVNVDRFAAYLRKMNDNTQFIVISHRRGTMEEADVLYGVTMQNEGVSKLLELRATEIEKNFVS